MWLWLQSQLLCAARRVWNVVACVHGHADVACMLILHACSPPPLGGLLQDFWRSAAARELKQAWARCLDSYARRARTGDRVLAASAAAGGRVAHNADV